jgi:hypothetical protein
MAATLHKIRSLLQFVVVTLPGKALAIGKVFTVVGFQGCFGGPQHDKGRFFTMAQSLTSTKPHPTAVGVSPYRHVTTKSIVLPSLITKSADGV